MLDPHQAPPTSRLDDDDDDDHDEGAGKKGKKSNRLEERLLDARTLIIADEVSDVLYRRVATMLTLLERKDRKAPITAFVNSPGGSADSGFAIYDLFRFSPCPITTVANGVVASAAVLIYLGAPQGRRVSLPNARFLLHQPSTATRGQASDIDITAREISKLRHRYNEVVAEATGKQVAAVEKDSDRDFWLSAQEAVAYKLVNRVLTSRAQLEEL
ncbi:MAG: ATP-dependent Clp protease proteolytic subunit [Deltaproteobacteria bacterium]|nr:ATP-dependent Clp protease proteolytic subunit [Deltaproteobacteria bacterium]